MVAGAAQAREQGACPPEGTAERAVQRGGPGTPNSCGEPRGRNREPHFPGTSREKPGPRGRHPRPGLPPRTLRLPHPAAAESGARGGGGGPNLSPFLQWDPEPGPWAPRDASLEPSGVRPLPAPRPAPLPRPRGPGPALVTHWGGETEAWAGTGAGGLVCACPRRPGPQGRRGPAGTRGARDAGSAAPGLQGRRPWARAAGAKGVQGAQAQGGDGQHSPQHPAGPPQETAASGGRAARARHPPSRPRPVSVAGRRAGGQEGARVSHALTRPPAPTRLGRKCRFPQLRKILFARTKGANPGGTAARPAAVLTGVRRRPPRPGVHTSAHHRGAVRLGPGPDPAASETKPQTVRVGVESP